MAGGNPLAALLSAKLEEMAEREQRPKMLPEAQVMELRVYAKDYDTCRFKVGDIITPRGMSNYRNRDTPHLVVEVPPEPLRRLAYDDIRDTATHQYGAKLDLRVMASRSATSP